MPQTKRRDILYDWTGSLEPGNVTSLVKLIQNDDGYEKIEGLVKNCKYTDVNWL
jgi:hypothetical protein